MQKAQCGRTSPNKSSACPVSSRVELFEEVQGGSMQLKHPEQAHNHRTHLPQLYLHQGNKVCRVVVRLFGVVQPPRTTSNLLETLQCRANIV